MTTTIDHAALDAAPTNAQTRYAVGQAEIIAAQCGALAGAVRAGDWRAARVAVATIEQESWLLVLGMPPGESTTPSITRCDGRPIVGSVL